MGRIGKPLKRKVHKLKPIGKSRSSLEFSNMPPSDEDFQHVPRAVRELFKPTRSLKKHKRVLKHSDDEEYLPDVSKKFANSQNSKPFVKRDRRVQDMPVTEAFPTNKPEGTIRNGKLSRKQRRHDRLKQKKIQKRVNMELKKESEEDFEPLHDEVAFGEVAQAPPKLRKLRAAVKMQEVLQFIPKSAKQSAPHNFGKNITPAKAVVLEAERARVVKQYNQLKLMKYYS